MHIEPGILSAAKIALANGAAIALLGSQSATLLRSPRLIVRTLIAALAFTALMQSLHMPVGPSELHLVGAMPIYLMFGFIPTLFGFASGLLLQGLVFEPQDLIHLGVNFLSLAVPLVTLHASFGDKLASLDTRTVLKLDAIYYSGVTLMVGFWLSIGEVATPFSEWAAFALSYASIVIAEPLLTIGLVRLAARRAQSPWMQFCCNVQGA